MGDNSSLPIRAAFGKSVPGDPMSKRILVAEDEALLALSLSDLLEAEGYIVTLAFDGEEALERATASEEGWCYDALVTDLNMPNLSGEELIRELRARHPEMPVLVVTGSPPLGGAAELGRHGGGHGPLALLPKPINDAQLLDALRRVTASPWAAAAE
jgi:CheY-like chemotaxis protein